MVTAGAKQLVLLSSCSPTLDLPPLLNPHHRIPLGTLVILQLLHPQAQPQGHTPGCWGHLCHSGLLVPGEGLTAQGIQTAGRAGDPCGCPGAVGSPGWLHPSTVPLGCTPRSGLPPACPSLLGYCGNVAPAPQVPTAVATLSDPSVC